MRTRTSTWFETSVQYEKTMEDGLQKKVIEQYVVDAFSFTEAESAITEEMSAYISGEFRVKTIRQAAYGEIFFSDAAADDRWFKAKLMFITIDEKTEKEKRTANTYLVQAHTIQQAMKYIEQVMGGTMIDYEVAAISDTKIFDVFEHENKVRRSEPDDRPEYESDENGEAPAAEPEKEGE
ncbi:DUF4494 domain-containing protein [Segatella buccae]|uniref:DUF4494 domain-containing protein n=1 Tax=Segatella buccae TaxID=28126 RepID=UPI0027B90DA8|nr:DUF4494 domain-containing protein [Segatella buccae]